MKLKFIGMSLLLFVISFMACSDDDTADTALGNDCIKRSIAPNIVGENIEFAYAMAIPPAAGKLVSVEVTSSISGAPGTYLDPASYHTNSSGQDVGVTVAEKSILEGNRCTTSFIVDTCASTLRCYYIIPEEARGKEVSFVFSVKASNGESSRYEMGPYKISRMDMVKNLKLTHGDACYLSVADLKVYTKAELDANPSLGARIDVIYGYNSKATLGQALYAPTAPKEYLGEAVVPSGATSDTQLVKVWALRDQQLSNLQWAIFVDDLDLTEQTFSAANTFYLGLKAENGVWVETGDKKHRAYVYINTVEAGKMTVSIKRYTF